ncbi:hypothetical protein [Coralloluteibacterium stylophorae]|uniref:Lipoprotein n=1 Tax=Coralloluteibacterium stylophorae TaxID=1776034 RepID=A0A8J7VXH8_9GAMM|nr:hypothetical protein [Coralloluteibacterium stylophorae]MBS7457896.1 hypothetical protein [Coralloluteibacterium stylophorae]
MTQTNRWLMWLLTGLAIVGCGKEETLTQGGYINLAGCEVPAGLTLEQAEKIECSAPVTGALP